MIKMLTVRTPWMKPIARQKLIRAIPSKTRPKENTAVNWIFAYLHILESRSEQNEAQGAHSWRLDLWNFCISAYLHTSIFAYLHICILAYLHNCIFAYFAQPFRARRGLSKLVGAKILNMSQLPFLPLH